MHQCINCSTPRHQSTSVPASEAITCLPCLPCLPHTTPLHSPPLHLPLCAAEPRSRQTTWHVTRLSESRYERAKCRTTSLRLRRVLSRVAAAAARTSSSAPCVDAGSGTDAATGNTTPSYVRTFTFRNVGHRHRRGSKVKSQETRVKNRTEQDKLRGSDEGTGWTDAMMLETSSMCLKFHYCCILGVRLGFELDNTTGPVC